MRSTAATLTWRRQAHHLPIGPMVLAALLWLVLSGHVCWATVPGPPIITLINQAAGHGDEASRLVAALVPQLCSDSPERLLPTGTTLQVSSGGPPFLATIRDTEAWYILPNYDGFGYEHLVHLGAADGGPDYWATVRMTACRRAIEEPFRVCQVDAQFWEG